MAKKLTLLLIISLASLLNAQSQITITGSVVAKENQSALPGVTVAEKGTSNRTTTNAAGTFSLEVAHANSILVFSYVGAVTQAYKLKGQEQLAISMRWDCIKDFFDAQQIDLYAQSGIITNPLGLQLGIASPYLFGGVIKGSYSYQGNLNKNHLQNAAIALNHFISTCGMDLDLSWNYRQAALANNFTTRANSIEADLNVKSITLTTGFSRLNLHQPQMPQNKNLSGLIVGISKYLKLPLYPTATIKAAIYQRQIEYQASIQVEHKKLLCFMKYYKINTFNELSLGIGMRLNYRLKKQKKQTKNSDDD